MMEGDSSRKRFFGGAIVLFLIYLFIISLAFIKEGAYFLGTSLFGFSLGNLNPLNSFGLGWLLTIILQSSGATTSFVSAAHSAGAISTQSLIYMVIGTRIGTSITILIVSLLILVRKRRDFRHGFEIGLANIIYALPITILMIFLENFFHIFSKVNYNSIILHSNGFSPIEKISGPIVRLASYYLPNYIIFILGVLFLLISINALSSTLSKYFGEKFLKEKIHTFLGKKHRAFFAGLLLTSVLLSTSITITLLVPFISKGLMNLRRAIPYMVGANFGGVVMVLLSLLVIGKSALPAIITYLSFSIIGLLWLFNTNYLLISTKFLSKSIIHVSRPKAILFIFLFIFLAIFLTLI